jgi:hypothetical protein
MKRRVFLQASAASLAFPCFGGPLDSISLDAMRGKPGFFRVGRSKKGNWWLVDADGKPFVYRGVCAINRAGTQGGRRAKPGPYATVVDTKYKTRQAFVDATIQRLRSWNFNALGAWCTEEFFDQGLPYTEIVEFARVRDRITAPGINLPDVFDPAWLSAVDAEANKLCTPRRDSKQVIGYFTDNELGWGQPDTDFIWGAPDQMNMKGATLLQVCLSQQKESPVYKETWKWLMARHEGSLAKLSFDWDTALAIEDDLRRFTVSTRWINTKGYGEDHRAFTREFARRYVQACAEAIRRYDPNHLILGARFGAPPGADVLAEFKQPWVDIISANNYRRNMSERMDIYYQAEKMPILIGEFSWGSPPFTNPKQWPEDAKGKPVHEFVRSAGPATLEGAIRHSGVVGYTWYRWIQNAVGVDKENQTGYGLVDDQDNEVMFNTKLLKEVNGRLESVAAGREN